MLSQLNIKIFADGADLSTMLALNDDPLISGLTTNPTLMRRAGIMDYEKFAREVLEYVTDKPLSLEVFADDFPEMERQARKVASWGRNVYVKIPVTNTRGEYTAHVVKALARDGIRVNVTAVMSMAQSSLAAGWLVPGVRGIISVFCGRIADTLRDPFELNIGAPSGLPEHEYLWASVREPWNIRQAAQMGYDIVTVPADILAKARKMDGMHLLDLSLETVKQFKRDAEGYSL